jgi:hypothetical protein
MYLPPFSDVPSSPLGGVGGVGLGGSAFGFKPFALSSSFFFSSNCLSLSFFSNSAFSFL